MKASVGGTGHFFSDISAYISGRLRGKIPCMHEAVSPSFFDDGCRRLSESKENGVIMRTPCLIAIFPDEVEAESSRGNLFAEAFKPVFSVERIKGARRRM